jgi:hypothetical protein
MGCQPCVLIQVQTLTLSVLSLTDRFDGQGLDA